MTTVGGFLASIETRRDGSLGCSHGLRYHVHIRVRDRDEWREAHRFARLLHMRGCVRVLYRAAGLEASAVAWEPETVDDDPIGRAWLSLHREDPRTRGNSTRKARTRKKTETPKTQAPSLPTEEKSAPTKRQWQFRLPDNRSATLTWPADLTKEDVELLWKYLESIRAMLEVEAEVYSMEPESD